MPMNVHGRFYCPRLSQEAYIYRLCSIEDSLELDAYAIYKSHVDYIETCTNLFLHASHLPKLVLSISHYDLQISKENDDASSYRAHTLLSNNAT